MYCGGPSSPACLLEHFLVGLTFEEVATQPGVDVDAGFQEPGDRRRVVTLRTPDHCVGPQDQDVIEFPGGGDARGWDADDVSGVAAFLPLVVHEDAERLRHARHRDEAVGDQRYLDIVVAQGVDRFGKVVEHLAEGQNCRLHLCS